MFKIPLKILSIFSKKPNKNRGPGRKIPIKFEVRSWDNHLKNIENWQRENARDLWLDAKYSTKPLYHYSWENDVVVNFVAEPNNEFDSKAIAVYLNGKHIGYVPKPINQTYYDLILKKKSAYAQIHGGHRKRIDEYGDLILEKGDPVVVIEI